MEKTKKPWRPGMIDDNPKTPEEFHEKTKAYLEYFKELDEKEKEAKEKAKK